MATKTYLHALNVGIVDGDKQHRIDLERMRLAADQQENWQADAVGKAFFRPGFGKVAETAGAARGRCIPFVAGPTDSFVLELTYLKLRVIDVHGEPPSIARAGLRTAGYRELCHLPSLVQHTGLQTSMRDFDRRHPAQPLAGLGDGGHAAAQAGGRHLGGQLLERDGEVAHHLLV